MTKILNTNTHLVILSIVIALALCGCTANLAQAPNISNTNSSTPSYIWHVGHAPQDFFGYDDFGVVSTIKGEDFELKVKGDSGTAVAAGQYEITVVYVENATCLSDIIADGLLFILTGLTHSTGTCKEVMETFNLQLKIEEDHLYLPFADDECDQNWAWIEDWGSAKANGAPTFRYLMGIRQTSGVNPMAGETTVVAGEKPPDNCP